MAAGHAAGKTSLKAVGVAGQRVEIAPAELAERNEVREADRPEESVAGAIGVVGPWVLRADDLDLARRQPAPSIPWRPPGAVEELGRGTPLGVRRVVRADEDRVPLHGPVVDALVGGREYP